ncbi:Niemann-Pick type C2 domain-containing protein, putative [Ixodes scapularis]|uniref:Niemann-Pick type C2 domain-containing protein, putative n=1 Tax=Ixodes scapularis TaxID=6945 RepID=B7PAQ8_IXOSC|nr:Niemann-Pick type C2 domain-containing protein, putative [Ixodes scapularis]|eukprot:XP_002407124.1 Niemann-Pick type C2 domain-containing protein, putative [Ixodes scapularis]
MNRLCYAASLVLVSAALVSAEFDVVKHEKCGGEFGEVRIDPCPELPCIFKKGTPLKLQVDFVAADSFKTLQMKLLGELSKGVWLPFPNFGRNACKKNGLTCPLESGKPYTLQSTLNVLSSFPTVRGSRGVYMKGDNQTIFCFLVPVKVSD